MFRRQLHTVGSLQPYPEFRHGEHMLRIPLVDMALLSTMVLLKVTFVGHVLVDILVATLCIAGRRL